MIAATVYVSNTTALLMSHLGQSMGLSGTTTDAVGFGSWGVEPTTVVRFGAIEPARLEAFVHEFFTEFPAEDAVYLEIVGQEGKMVYRPHAPNAHEPGLILDKGPLYDPCVACDITI